MYADLLEDVVADENLTVSYTVRELLERIERNQISEFSALRESLARKADKSDLDAVHVSITGLTTRVIELERADEGRTVKANEEAMARETAWKRRELKMALWTVAAGWAVAIATALLIIHP